MRKHLLVVIYAISLITLSNNAFAFACTVDGGVEIGNGNTNVIVNLEPTINPGQNLVIDLSQHIYCYNSYGGGIDTDHINLKEGSRFGPALNNFSGTVYWNGSIYPFPLTSSTNVLDVGEKTPLPLPLRLYITPIGAAGGTVINAGDIVAYIHMYKIAELNGGDPRDFTWTIIAGNTVTMPTGGCDVDNRNITVNLPDYPGSADVPIKVYCSSSQKLYFYLTGSTTDINNQIFTNTSPESTKASGLGISILRQGTALSSGQSVQIGEVNTTPVSLGLSAKYAKTGVQITAGTVQSVIGLTFTYQ